jgi:hypothetical protein
MQQDINKAQRFCTHAAQRGLNRNTGWKMQTASAMKDEKPGSGGLNWRQRKKANMRRHALVDGYVAALGGADRVGTLVMVEIERCVDMTLLAEGMRAKALRGEAIDIGDLTRLEGAVSRVIRSLNIPPPGAAPPGDDAWRKFLAQHAPTDEGDG